MILVTALACTPAPPEPPWPASRVLADHEDAPTALVADASSVIFVTGSNQASRDRGTNDIRRISLADGTVSVLVDGGQRIPNGALALDDGFLYWADTDSVLRVPIAGGESEVVVGGADGGPVRAKELAVDADTVYWIEQTREGGPPEPIRSAPKTPGGPVSALTEPLRGANGLCADGDALYFATPEGLRRVAKASGGAVPLPGGPTGTTVGLVQDADSFYTARLDGGNATLLRVPKDGGAPVALAPSVDWTGELAVDDHYVWYFDAAPNHRIALKRVPKYGGYSETLDTGARGTVGPLAVGERDVFFTDGARVLARAR